MTSTTATRKNRRAKGPVYEVRMALSRTQGEEITQARMAEMMNCSYYTVKSLEKSGKLPSDPHIVERFLQLAATVGFQVEMLPAKAEKEEKVSPQLAMLPEEAREMVIEDQAQGIVKKIRSRDDKAISVALALFSSSAREVQNRVIAIFNSTSSQNSKKNV